MRRRFSAVLYDTEIVYKVEVKSVLRIGSAYNNVRTANVNIAQISNVSNFFEHKLYFIFI
jgi:purine-nucleoside phosphorylase